MQTGSILIFVAVVGLMLGPDALAQHAQTVPSSPAGNASQSTRRGKTTQSKNTFTQASSNKSVPPKNAPAQHQAGKKGYQSSSHGGGVGVGIGATIDLGGIGQRQAEPDPFAVGGPSISQTQERPEKPKTKKKKT